MEHLTPDLFNNDLILLQETGKRVQKDFLDFGFEIDFSGGEINIAEHLYLQLVPIFDQLLKSQKSLLMRVLYKVDISQEKLDKAKLKYPSVPLAEILSVLTLEREYQKVWSRKYFK